MKLNTGRQYTRAQRKEIDKHNAHLRGLLKQYASTPYEKASLNASWKMYARTNNRNSDNLQVRENGFEIGAKMIDSQNKPRKNRKVYHWALIGLLAGSAVTILILKILL